jgi:catalase
MSDAEKKHMVSAAQFELSKCYETEVQQAAVNRFNLIDHDFALQVAEALSDVKVPDAVNANHGKKSAFLSQVEGKSQTFTAEGRKVGVYVLPGFEYSQVAGIKKALEAVPMIVKIVRHIWHLHPISY